jgi:hypothetical protein
LNCKFAIREDVKTRSVYCGKRDQWVSVKYCNLCLDHEAGSPKLICNKQSMLFDNYNYNIASCNKRGFWGLNFFIKEISSLVSEVHFWV